MAWRPGLERTCSLLWHGNQGPGALRQGMQGLVRLLRTLTPMSSRYLPWLCTEGQALCHRSQRALVPQPAGYSMQAAAQRAFC